MRSIILVVGNRPNKTSKFFRKGFKRARDIFIYFVEINIWFFLLPSTFFAGKPKTDNCTYCNLKMQNVQAAWVNSLPLQLKTFKK